MKIVSAQTEIDARWMRQALAAAHEAQQRNEVPVGTCVVVGETLLSVAGNQTCADRDPTAHMPRSSLYAKPLGRLTTIA